MKNKLRTNKKLINLLRHETPKQRQKFLNEVDQVLLSLGLGFDLVAASRPAVTMDLATQRLLAVVESEKDRAVNREDFVKAQKIQEQINQLRDIGIQLIIEEAHKQGAIVEITELIDGYYRDIQDMGGNRWDTSSLLKRLQDND